MAVIKSEDVTMQHFQLMTPGGHYMLDLKAHYLNGSPFKAWMHWYSSHGPDTWMQDDRWETESTHLIVAMILEGKKFLRYVRDYKAEHHGSIKEAVRLYTTIAFGGSLRATRVRDGRERSCGTS